MRRRPTASRRRRRATSGTPTAGPSRSTRSITTTSAACRNGRRAPGSRRSRSISASSPGRTDCGRSMPSSPRRRRLRAKKGGMSASIILAIQDAEEVGRRLEAASHVVKKAPDAQAALALAQQEPPELILVEQLPATPAAGDVPVIVLAERRDARALAQAFQLGAIDVFIKPLPAPALVARIEARLEQLASERTAQLEGTERRVARLLRAMQWHESALGGQRAQRLAEYARALAQAAGARDVACELLARAAPLHDVGRLAAPAAEFERHAALGAEIIGEHDDALLKLARTVALTHHERW